MADLHRRYEIRCPVHGFISVSSWERDIINHPIFQRLRRIRQLAWTDQVYPGAMHTRFEHSLGVMHTATLLYDAISNRSADILKSELAYDDSGLQRHRVLVRLAALLHDIGHGPFSHAAEELMPLQIDGSRYEHEQYSAAIVRTCLRDVIEDHPLNQNYGFRADDVAALLEGSTGARNALFWRGIITGQMDADRMDYLLRDSLHAGVQYGRFDLHRLINTVTVTPRLEDEMAPRLGIEEDGIHAAEALILARYFMFTQIYFHKTRVAFDYHLESALRELLPGGHFPPPETGRLEEYLRWDDWRVLGMLADGQGGEHGRALAGRRHHRLVYRTPEVPGPVDLDELDGARAKLGKLLAAERTAGKSWYKFENEDIPVSRGGEVRPLSAYSHVVANLKTNRQTLLYVRPEDCDVARERLNLS